MVKMPQFAAIGEGDYSPMFDLIREELQSTDCLIGNLETPVAGREAGYSSRPYSFNTPDSFVKALKETGFHILTTANNHCLDRGREGVERTLDMLDVQGIKHIGTYRRRTDDRWIVLEIEGRKVALLSYTYGTNSVFNGHRLSRLNRFKVALTETQPPKLRVPTRWNIPLRLFNKIASKTIYRRRELLGDIKRDIVNAKKRGGADFVIMCLHYGGQYTDFPTPQTRKMVDWLFNNGVDLVIGNHEHIVHPIHRTPAGKVAAYCLGNFSSTPGDLSDDIKEIAVRNRTDYSLLLTLEFPVNWIYPTVSFKVLKSVLGEDGIARTMVAASDDPDEQWVREKAMCEMK